MSRRGFTLVEVLVALVIVALGMAALLGTMSSAADTTVYLREKTFANWIALNRLTELRLQSTAPTAGKSEGELEYAGRRWRYEQEVVALDFPGLTRIDLRVRPADAAEPRRPGQRRAFTSETSAVIGAAIAQRNGTLPDWNGAPFDGAPNTAGPDGSAEDAPSEPPPEDGAAEGAEPPTAPDPGRT